MNRGLLASIAFVVTSIPLAALAQDVRDADTLPAGVGGLLIQPAIGYGQGSLERFGRGWQLTRESLIADFNGIDLTEVIAGDGAEAIKSTIGDLGITNFVGSQQSFALNLMAAVGITDRLTLAALWPYMSVSYDLDVWLTPTANQSHYRVKDANAITCPGGEFQLSDPAQLNEIIEDAGESYRFNVDDLRRALVSDCLGYFDPVDRLERGADGLVHGKGARQYSGFRDLVLGAKYQFFHGRKLHLAGLAYVIAPTGTVEDPRDLFDVNFGDGQWDAAILAGVTVPLDDLGLRFAASAGYEISFGDRIERRLNAITFSDELETRLARGEISEEELFDQHLDDGSMIPIVTRFDTAPVDRKLGDTVYVYTGVSVQLLEWLSVGVTLDMLHHFRDHVSSIGDRPAPAKPYLTEAQIRAQVDQLIKDGTVDEADRITELKRRLPESEGRKRAGYSWHTVRGNLVAGIGIGFNTLAMFQRGDFPLPIIASIAASRFIAGQNLDTPDGINATIALPLPFFLLTGSEPKEMPYDDEPEDQPEKELTAPPIVPPPGTINPPDADTLPASGGSSMGPNEAPEASTPVTTP
ncbi:MAG: transporter [Deltaproteobacteria bacterium]|nr:transporter [Deltaproteobacteria bacterium]